MTRIVCREVSSPAEIAECFAIRHKIFVEEQKLFCETDRDEYDDRAVHIAALCEGRIIGTVRLYKERDGLWWGGRLAVLKEFRGKAGRLLVQAATDYVRQHQARSFRAQVQAGNIKFFERLGWKRIGETVLYHGKPHVLMEAPLSEGTFLFRTQRPP